MGHAAPTSTGLFVSGWYSDVEGGDAWRAKRCADHSRAVPEEYEAKRGTYVNAVRRWWCQGDQFDWLTLYLNTRGIRLIWRAVIAAVIASMAMVPAVVLAGPTLPRYPAAEVVSPVASGVGMTVALLWLIRWPTRGQSVVYALTGSVCITAACLVQRDPLAALLGSCAFAVLSIDVRVAAAPPGGTDVFRRGDDRFG